METVKIVGMKFLGYLCLILLLAMALLPATVEASG
jgi:hypothetical protein